VPDYLPHTEDELTQMLAFLGLSSLDELFSAVPAALRLGRGLALADGSPEPDVLARMESLGRANLARSDRLVCFAGGGAYDHEVPPVVRALAGRSEFVTSYTPYQPEVAQGILQAVFEFQTMVARLAGLPVANASLYDGANAVVEGVNLGVAASGRQTVWLSSGVQPHWRAVLRTFAAGTGHRLVDIPLEAGVTAWPEPGADADLPGVLVVGYPNYLGCLEDLGAARRICDATGALLVVVADPVSAAILRAPGEWGADVVVGEGQPLGTALSFGGPYLGLFAVAQAHVRRLPGRLVGETVDVEGTRAYVTTLRAREQDIRREKATSNVCTNQTLMAIYAAVQLGWLGTSGLREVALRCARGTRFCRESLLALSGVEPLTGTTPTVREFAVRTPIPGRLAVERLAEEGYLGGLALADLVGDGGDGSVSADDAVHGLLVAVTERRTRSEVEGFVRTLDKVVR
jgi:glycine dehydrogenase subunit 1